MSKEFKKYSSGLLTSGENSKVWRLTGSRTDVISAGVVQLMKPVKTGQNFWSKIATGVACFVKDWTVKGFFIMVSHC